MTRADVDWADRDQVADYLTETAITLAGLVRDDDPKAVHRWLRLRVPAGEWVSLAVILAALVPTDATTSRLLQWARLRNITQPQRESESSNIRLVTHPTNGQPASLTGHMRPPTGHSGDDT